MLVWGKVSCGNGPNHFVKVEKQQHCSTTNVVLQGLENLFLVRWQMDAPLATLQSAGRDFPGIIKTDLVLWCSCCSASQNCPSLQFFYSHKNLGSILSRFRSFVQVYHRWNFLFPQVSSLAHIWDESLPGWLSSLFSCFTNLLHYG